MAPQNHPDQPNSSFPNDLWLKIFETGVNGSRFGCEDLCSLSISCKSFDSLSKQDTLWSSLLARDFPASPHTHSSSMKSVYKRRLGMELHRLRDSISRESADTERQLIFLSQRIKLIRHEFTVHNGPVRELAADIVKFGNRSPVDYHGRFKAIYDPVVLLVEQLKKLSGALLHMINFRECGAQPTAIDYQAPPKYSAPSSVSTTQLDAIISLLEKKAAHVFTEYEKCFNYLLQEQGQIQALLDRQQEHNKQLVKLTTRLLFFDESLGLNDAHNDQE